MRVVCLVPSWTETLIECGVNVVGRTRYCVHPADKVASLAVVGGTKDVQWSKVAALAPDMVIFDKEENTLEMAQTCPFPYFATDVKSVHDMPQALRLLSQQLCSDALLDLSVRYQAVLAEKKQCSPEVLPLLSGDFASSTSVLNDQRTWLYLIWRKPFMSVGRDTFIYSVFEHLGFADKVLTFDDRYPSLDEEWIREQNPVLLCSSEPYPFAGKLEQTRAELKLDAVLIDGEPMCWYGVRSLHYLESI
ncbi:ABC transporter substrate-binding protein [Oceanisphaera arctica]|uniref:ABC transporter substrate-binding protein n=1 Tax=Oceanisphaera arctica TaxID=641510 RepID=UPI000CEBF7A6|nr:helical backbone metal receptor [Oceanisphaera arctica]GHA08710.1 iron ABC transporter [Oceanisphaera arctica]